MVKRVSMWTLRTLVLALMLAALAAPGIANAAQGGTITGRTGVNFTGSVHGEALLEVTIVCAWN